MLMTNCIFSAPCCGLKDDQDDTPIVGLSESTSMALYGFYGNWLIYWKWTM